LWQGCFGAVYRLSRQIQPLKFECCCLLRENDIAHLRFQLSSQIIKPNPHQSLNQI